MGKQGNREACRYENMEMKKQGKQKHGNMDIVKYGSMEVWKYWKYGNEETRKQGNLQI